MIEEHKIMYEKVKDLLEKHAASRYAAEELAPRVAEHSLMMNHMYEDLGFESRTQMGKFMQHHFTTLSEMKPKEKLWKKFLYDSIGEVAPACATCDDQLTCFACTVKEMSA